ncbi:tryptophan synthase beta subunit-like PLP-dependent enzyme [Xylaria sp. FL1777]|nr:tryptophan synthase beta subunit-like PLP-dependent enzyme [Xylaria sp. FL1777]
MGSYVPDLPKLHIETPCIPSRELSRATGCNIYLKLENLQPSGSFKSRGVGTLMSRALQSSSTGRTHFYCSSGGNAGLACAEAARTLGQPCDVFLPSRTPELVLAKLAALGATPHRAGNVWPEADAHCRAAAASDPDGVYVPPFDDPDVWDGNATLVDELAALEAKGFFGRDGAGGGDGAIDAIVCNVGGGGLLNGVMEGIERNYNSSSSSSSSSTSTSTSTSTIPRSRPAVLALETAGADSLAASIRAGAHVTIPGITSVATSLGAPRVSAQTYRWAETCGATTFTFPSPPPPSKPIDPSSTSLGSKGGATTHLTSVVVSDADAVSACARFLDDARLLVEVSCGATLASAYNSEAILRAALAPDADDERWGRMNVVLVVCGGSSISFGLLGAYREQFGV